MFRQPALAPLWQLFAPWTVLRGLDIDLMQATIVKLLIVNLLLQAVDGVASYHIISAGIPEENPVVATFIEQWGVLGGLFYAKAMGCALVILIFMLRKRLDVIVTQGLTVLAYVYSFLGVFLIAKLFIVTV